MDGSPNRVCTPFGEQSALGTLSRNKGGNTVNIYFLIWLENASYLISTQSIYIHVYRKHDGYDMYMYFY